MAVQGVPIGLLMDAMLLIGALGVILRALKSHDWSYFDVPGKYVVLIWVAYHLLQVGNPTAASRVAWFYVMRPAVAYPFLYFIAMNMLKSPSDLKKFGVSLFPESQSLYFGAYISRLMDTLILK